MKSNRPRIMLSAPASGGGKTVLTTGLLRALVARGMRPAAFKCGPDYIDPMFHREVMGVPGRNLDLFFTAPDVVRGLLCRGAGESDIAVMEGVMGYYDGVGAGTQASSWHLATETRTPAVLIVRPKGAFLSLAAMVEGFRRFREDSMIRGVILNRCGDAFFRKLRPMLEGEAGVRVFGHLPDLPEASFESRHLGLVTPDAVGEHRERIRSLADHMEKSVDISGLIALAESAPDLSAPLPDIAAVTGTPVRIAVAKDAAFCFYYQENLELLRSLGAELVFFSPLADSRLPEGIGGLYLGGGYPEVRADDLAANASMRSDIREAVISGLPTIAECGGFLYLQTELEDAAGRKHPMAGVFEGTGYNTGRLGRFGYIRLRARRDNLLCRAGEEIPAHEFHYWDSANTGDACTARKASGEYSWDCVIANETVFAGFPHLYFWGAPATARRFVEAATRENRLR